MFLTDEDNAHLEQVDGHPIRCLLLKRVAMAIVNDYILSSYLGDCAVN